MDLIYGVWLVAAQAVTVVVILLAVARQLGIPFIEHSSATLLCGGEDAQYWTARALAGVLGDPPMILNTATVDRYLMRDGTSIDYVRFDADAPPVYRIAALKQIVLPLWARKTPRDIAEGVRAALADAGYGVQVISRPDPAFPEGAIILVLSDAFTDDEDEYGFGILIRKSAFRVGGQRPQRFKGWSRDF